MSGVDPASGDYRTLAIERRPASLHATMSRPGQPNRISEALLCELEAVLDESERDPRCRMVVLRGTPQAFCLGMDFTDVADKMAHTDAGEAGPRAARFMRVLRRITEHSRVVACIVEGRVLGGGVGLVAACDIAVATEGAEFGLPELLWGLIPANIMPFLVRRMGCQRAYHLALTTQNIPAAQAREAGLVDVVSATPDEHLRRMLPRLARVETKTLSDLKRYMRRMWIVDDAMEHAAVMEFQRLIAQPSVRDRLGDLAQLGMPPEGRDR